MTDFGWSYPPGCSGPPEEFEDYSNEWDLLEAELGNLGSGRNSECWPVAAFGWKDADLDPGGCCGIEEVTLLDDVCARVKVGGHKTFCCPGHEFPYEAPEAALEAAMDEATEVVCGSFGDPVGSGDWTGDDWSFSFKEEITIDYEWDEDNDEMIPELARKVFEAARETVRPYQEAWADIDKALDGIYDRLVTEYGGGE